MGDTVTIACKLRNGLQIGGIVVRGYFQAIGEPIPPDSLYGYALTENFPKQTWDEWHALMRDEPLVTGNHVMAAESRDAIRQLIAQRVGYRKRVLGTKAYGG